MSRLVPWMMLAGCLVALVLLVSCDTLSVVESWRAPDIAGRKFHKLLVVNGAKKDAARQTNEDILVAEFTSRRVDAVASHTLVPSQEKADPAALANAVKSANADAVLTVQVVNIEKTTRIEPGTPAAYPGYWPPYGFHSWDMYQYYGSPIFYDPPTIVTYETATIQANLYDALSGKLLWAVTMQTSEPRRTLAASRELAKIIVYGLIKEGLI